MERLSAWRQDAMRTRAYWVLHQQIEIGQRGCGDDGTGLHYDALRRSVQMPDFGQPGWNRAAVLQLPRIWMQRELGHCRIFRRFFCWWNSTDEDDFLGSSWHSANLVYTFSLNWRKTNWIQSLIHYLTSPVPIIIGLLYHSLFLASLLFLALCF